MLLLSKQASCVYDMRVCLPAQCFGVMVMSGAVSQWYFTVDKATLKGCLCARSCSRAARSVHAVWVLQPPRTLS